MGVQVLLPVIMGVQDLLSISDLPVIDHGCPGSPSNLSRELAVLLSLIDHGCPVLQVPFFQVAGNRPWVSRFYPINITNL
jgi:hypothetical protein